MRGKRKVIEEKHLPFLISYIGKKTLKLSEFEAMLNEPEMAESLAEEMMAVLRSGDLVAINALLPSRINSPAWRRLWLSEKGREHRRQNPRSEHTIRRDLAEELKDWADNNDINEAVEVLLDYVKKSGR